MPPNVLIICTDQQRADSLGCSGNRHVRTPHLDALAAAGTRCSRFHTCNSICMPSRASLLTGTYPSVHGVWTNGVPLPRRGYLPETSAEHGGLRPGQSAMAGIPTLADVFAAAGYATASIGKLHLTPTQSHPSLGYQECRQVWVDGGYRDWTGPYYGFQHCELSIGHGEDSSGHYGRWVDERFPAALSLARDRQRHGTREFPALRQLFVGGLPSAANQSSWCAERAEHWLRNRDHGAPFLLWVGINDPHHPFILPADLAEGFGEPEVAPGPLDGHDGHGKPAALRRFMKPGSGWGCPPDAVRRVRQYTDAMISVLDTAVGRILAALAATGADRDTIVVFTSDHGDYLGELGLIYKTSHASRMLNRVPLLIRGVPGMPSVLDLPIGSCDLVPSLCDWCGIAPPELVQGEPLRSIVAEGRQDPVLGIEIPNEPTERNLTIYDRNHRLTWYPATGELELYDHAIDDAEASNRADDPAYEGIRRKMLGDLTRQIAAYHLPRFGRVAIW